MLTRFLRNANPTRYRLETHSFAADFKGWIQLDLERTGYYYSNEHLTFTGCVAFRDAQPNLRVDMYLLGEVKKAFPLPTEAVTSTTLPDGVDLAGEPHRFQFRFPLKQLNGNDVVFRLISGHEQQPARLFDIALITDDIDIEPVFVLGSPRTGTTVIGNAVRTALGGKNYGEHHTGYLCANLIAEIDQYYSTYHTRNDRGTFIYDSSPALFKLKAGQSIKEIYAWYHRQRWWIDKTPGRNMIRSLPALLSIWPDLKLIYCKRRAIENVQSRLKKFPQLDLEQHSRQWVETARLWTEIKGQLTIPFIEVEHFDILHNRKGVGEQIAGLIPAVDPAFIQRYLDGNHPQRTGGAPTVRSLQSIPWSADEKALFTEITEDMMKAEGYDYSDAYFRPGEILRDEHQDHNPQDTAQPPPIGLRIDPLTHPHPDE